MTACNRHNEAAALRAVDRHRRICTEKIGDSDVAHFSQAGIIRAGEFRTGISFSRNIVQTDRGQRCLIDVDTLGIDHSRYIRSR